MQRGLCLIAIVIACLALSAAPAGAVNLTGGCQGQGTSFDKDHNQIMAATAPSAEPGTSGNPFLVDYDGTVEYAGTGPLVLNHHWEIKVFGIPVKSGGAPNGSHQTATIGVADVSDYLPFKITGVYYVSGEIHGDGGACSGDAYVKLLGSPVGTVPWIVAIGLIVIGVALGYASLPKARPSAAGLSGLEAVFVASGGPPPAPPIAEPMPPPAPVSNEPPTAREHAPFGEPEPTVQQPPTPSPPPPPPPSPSSPPPSSPPPADGSPA
jgi:hypothetical protein